MQSKVANNYTVANLIVLPAISFDLDQLVWILEKIALIRNYPKITLIEVNFMESYISISKISLNEVLLLYKSLSATIHDPGSSPWSLKPMLQIDG